MCHYHHSHDSLTLAISALLDKIITVSSKSNDY